jgi:hypothetical protein
MESSQFARGGVGGFYNLQEETKCYQRRMQIFLAVRIVCSNALECLNCAAAVCEPVDRQDQDRPDPLLNPWNRAATL